MIPENSFQDPALEQALSEIRDEAVDPAVEQVDQAPEGWFEIVFQAGALEQLGEEIEEVGEGGVAGFGVGQRAVIGLVVVRACAKEGQFFQKHCGGGAGRRVAGG